MNYTLLKNIIQYLDEYQSSNSSVKIEDFIIWINNKLFNSSSDDIHTAHDDLLIPFKLLHISKELKKQAKSILSDSLISSLDEYSFLLHLYHQDSFRKMELVELHNIEAPTGIEIIRRLLKNKLVEEFPDLEDKRAKRIRITKAGKSIIKKIKPNIDRSFSNFTSNLSLDEKIQISGIFDKMIK